MKSKLVIALFVFISFYTVFNRQQYNNLFWLDTAAYYLYLPAVFIYHDVGDLNFYPAVNKKYAVTGTSDDYGIFGQPTGHKTLKYAVGTAVFELPFFLLAHAWCTVTHSFAADGYTLPYRLSAIAACILWAAAGLLLLMAFLRRYFSDNITAFVLLCVGLGTELFYYCAFFPGMSHPFSFFLFAWVLYLTQRVFNEHRSGAILWMGIALGLVVITRPVNILVVLVPLLWQVCDRRTIVERVQFLVGQYRQVLVSLFLFLLVTLIQTGYWKYTTGHWIHYSYKGERFNFLRPHVWEGLFSYKKGWFVYTPIAFVAFIGLIFFWIRERKKAPGIVVFFAVMIYVVFCWEQWWYGGGFSARALLETLPVAAYPLAVLVQYVLGLRNTVVKTGFVTVMLLLVALNLFQSYQSSICILDGGRMTKAYYWRVFGKVEVNDDDHRLMQTEEAFYKQWDDCVKQ